MPLKGAFLRVFGVSGWHILGFSTAVLPSYWAEPRGAALLMLIVFPQNEGREVPKSCGRVEKLNSFSMCFPPGRIA